MKIEVNYDDDLENNNINIYSDRLYIFINKNN